MALTHDSTHFKDRATGLQIVVLTGPGNFTKWMRDFKLVADLKNVWQLIDPDRAAEANRKYKPIRPAKPLKSYASQQLEDGYYTYQNDATEYTLDLAEYKEQQNKLHEARSLLLATITPALRNYVSDKSVPSQVLATIEMLCRPSDREAQEHFVRKLEDLKYSDFAGIEDCIDFIIACQQDLKSLGVSYTDDQVIAKIISVLPESFEDSSIPWSSVSGTAGLRMLHTQLPNLEARLASEGKL